MHFNQSFYDIELSKRNFHNLLVGTWFFLIIFLSEYLTEKTGFNFEIFSYTLGLILLFFSFYFLIYNREERRFKTLSEITTSDNIGNYLQYFFILYMQNFTYALPLVGVITICILSLTFLAIVAIIIKESIYNFSLLNLVIVGHLLLLYFLYSWTINNFRRNYGNEIIGSYWSKPEFEAKYYVDISRSSKSKKPRKVSAQLEVYSETIDDDYPTEDMYGNEFYKSSKENFVLLKNIQLDNGGTLEFEDCFLKLNRERSCIDVNGSYWYIFLTDEKIE